MRKSGHTESKKESEAKVTESNRSRPHPEFLLLFLSLFLSHIAAQIVDLHAPIACAGTTYFAQPDALKGSLGITLKEVRKALCWGLVPVLFT